jgi:Uma2 family endonuclease
VGLSSTDADCRVNIGIAISVDGWMIRVFADRHESKRHPMSENTNTRHFRWIERIKSSLEVLLSHDPQVFVTTNLMWHPVQESLDKRVVPSLMVVFGRPKIPRSFYKQWEEENIAPQVVIDVRSSGNTISEMSKKRLFYSHYGVKEYYVYDPNRETLDGYIRGEYQSLQWIDNLQDWVSPRLKIRFELSMSGLAIYQSDSTPLLVLS